MNIVSQVTVPLTSDVDTYIFKNQMKSVDFPTSMCEDRFDY